jgi:hypothetical protein
MRMGNGPSSERESPCITTTNVTNPCDRFLKHATTHLPIEWNVSVKGKSAWRGEWAALRPRFKILQCTSCRLQAFQETDSRLDTHPRPWLHDARDFVGTMWADEVALWWRIKREMEDMYGPWAPRG